MTRNAPVAFTGAEFELAEWSRLVHDAPDPADRVAELLRRPAWHARAACRGMGTDLFFPEKHAPAAKLREARETCAACPVRAECYDTADADPSTEGLWAGTSANQRRKARRVGA